MKTIKGPAIFLAQFAGDVAPYNSLTASGALGRRARLQGRADPDLGRAADRPAPRRRKPRLLRRAARHPAPRRRGDHRTVHASAGPAGRGASRLRRDDRRLRGARGARQPEGAAGMGGRAAEAGGEGVAQSRPHRACDLLRRAGLAVPLSVAAASGRAGRRRLSTSWRAAGGRSWTSSTRTASTSATRSIRARTCTTASPTRCSSSGGQPPRACLLYDPSHFVLQQLDYLEYIDIYHERIRMFHVKDAEFSPSGRKGVYGGFQSWVNRAGRFRSLGDGQVDFAVDLLEADAIRLRRLGGAGMGMLHQGQRAGRGRGRAVHRAAHHPDRRARLRRFRRERRRSRRQPQPAGDRLT